MRHKAKTAVLTVLAFGASLAPAAAHHVMGGKLPQTFIEGLLSGLGHPIIGPDHLVAVIAVGCLAALHRRGVLLAVGYVLAMVIGVVLHVRGTTVPAAEAMVALSLLLLGALMIWRQPMSTGVVTALFLVTGLVHGYALGESIVGAEPAPLASYFAGLAVIQSLIVLVAFRLARMVIAPGTQMPPLLRAAGAAVAIFGIIGLMGQFGSGA
jgi:urease accessory protein